MSCAPLFLAVVAAACVVFLSPGVEATSNDVFGAVNRHLNVGPFEYGASEKGDSATDGNSLLDVNYRILPNGDNGAVLSSDAEISRGASRLENSEKRETIEEEKQLETKDDVLRHIIPVLGNGASVARKIGPRSERSLRSSQLPLKDSSRHSGEKKAMSERGILTSLFPFRVEQHTDENGIENRDFGAAGKDVRLSERNLKSSQPKSRSFRVKRDNANDNVESPNETRSSKPDVEDNISISVETEVNKDAVSPTGENTTSASVTSVSEKPQDINREATSRAPESSTDSTEEGSPKSLNLDVTTSTPLSTSGQRDSRKGKSNCEIKLEESTASPEVSRKSLRKPDNLIDGRKQAKENLPHVADDPEIPTSKDRHSRSEGVIPVTGKVLTMHVSFTFDTKDNSSGHGDHPHLPTDAAPEEYEHTLGEEDGDQYKKDATDNSSIPPHFVHFPGDGDTPNFPEHPGQGGAISAYFDQLPMPSGAFDVFTSLQHDGVPTSGRNEIRDVILDQVIKMLFDPLATAPIDNRQVVADQLDELSEPLLLSLMNRAPLAGLAASQSEYPVLYRTPPSVIDLLMPQYGEQSQQVVPPLVSKQLRPSKLFNAAPPDYNQHSIGSLGSPKHQHRTDDAVSSTCLCSGNAVDARSFNVRPKRHADLHGQGKPHTTGCCQRNRG